MTGERQLQLHEFQYYIQTGLGNQALCTCGWTSALVLYEYTSRARAWSEWRNHRDDEIVGLPSEWKQALTGQEP